MAKESLKRLLVAEMQKCEEEAILAQCLGLSEDPKFQEAVRSDTHQGRIRNLKDMGFTFPPKSRKDSKGKQRRGIESRPLAEEAKAITLMAFRNGPLEDIHHSRISQAEMKTLMKFAVDRVYTLLCLRDCMPNLFEKVSDRANLQTYKWDDPILVDPETIG